MAEIEGATEHPSDETLAAFLDGALDGDERERVLAHLAECDECRAFAADWACAVVAESAGERGEVTERVGKTPAETKRKVELKPLPESERGDAPGFCPNCRKRVSAEGGFCAHCGANLSEAYISCAVCSHRVGASDTFCRNCGVPLKAEAVSREEEGVFLYEYGSLFAGVLCFIISFFVPGYFWQFLIAFAVFEVLFVYFRLKREVLLKLIDALRSGDKEKEEEILQRLRRRFKA